MRAVIICGGRITDYDYIKKQIRSGDTVICADSGYDHAMKMQVNADLIVGDFDSIGEIPSGIEVVRYPAKKGQTDTEIAVGHARLMGLRDFLIIAGTGSRMDHTLANILMLKDCLSRGEHAEIMDEHNKIMITETKLCLCGDKGSIVSLVPLSDCCGVTTENLEYPLCEAELMMGKGLGVSNVMTENEACVSLRSGTLLVIQAKD